MKKFITKQAGVLTIADLKTVKGKTIYTVFIILLTICAIASLFPAIWTILTAFKDSQEILEPTIFPSNMSWGKVVERITTSWERAQLGTPLIDTTVVSIGCAFFNIVICGLVGYGISKLRPSGSKALFTAIVWSMMMPGQIRMVPVYMGYLHFPFASSKMGVSLLDTYWPFWLGSAAHCYSILLFKNAFDGLSDSYVEAAKIDGCTNLGIFFRIMLPLCTPIIIYQGINAFSGPWLDYITPLLYLDKHKTVPLMLYLGKGDNMKMNDLFMGYIYASIPPFIIFAIFQRYILGGINIGGVKG